MLGIIQGERCLTNRPDPSFKVPNMVILLSRWLGYDLQWWCSTYIHTRLFFTPMIPYIKKAQMLVKKVMLKK